MIPFEETTATMKRQKGHQDSLTSSATKKLPLFKKEVQEIMRKRSTSRSNSKEKDKESPEKKKSPIKFEYLYGGSPPKLNTTETLSAVKLEQGPSFEDEIGPKHPTKRLFKDLSESRNFLNEKTGGEFYKGDENPISMGSFHINQGIASILSGSSASFEGSHKRTRSLTSSANRNRENSLKKAEKLEVLSRILKGTERVSIRRMDEYVQYEQILVKIKRILDSSCHKTKEIAFNLVKLVPVLWRLRKTSLLRIGDIKKRKKESNLKEILRKWGLGVKWKEKAASKLRMVNMITLMNFRQMKQHAWNRLHSGSRAPLSQLKPSKETHLLRIPLVKRLGMVLRGLLRTRVQWAMASIKNKKEREKLKRTFGLFSKIESKRHLRLIAFGLGSLLKNASTQKIEELAVTSIQKRKTEKMKRGFFMELSMERAETKIEKERKKEQGVLLLRTIRKIKGKLTLSGFRSLYLFWKNQKRNQEALKSEKGRKYFETKALSCKLHALFKMKKLCAFRMIQMKIKAERTRNEFKVALFQNRKEQRRLRVSFNMIKSKGRKTKMGKGLDEFIGVKMRILIGRVRNLEIKRQLVFFSQMTRNALITRLKEQKEAIGEELSCGEYQSDSQRAIEKAKGARRNQMAMFFYQTCINILRNDRNMSLNWAFSSLKRKSLARIQEDSNGAFENDDQRSLDESSKRKWYNGSKEPLKNMGQYPPWSEGSRKVSFNHKEIEETVVHDGFGEGKSKEKWNSIE